MIYYYLNGKKISQEDLTSRIHRDELYLAETSCERWYVMRGRRAIFGHGQTIAKLADCQRWLMETKLGAEAAHETE